MAGRGKDNSNATRLRLGRFWLWYRRDRDDWAICWLDGRTTRRKSLGIGGGTPDAPPEAAQIALAEHFNARPVDPDKAPPPEDVLVDDITRRWLAEHVTTLDAPDRYATSVLIWEEFYDRLRRDGEMPDPYTVAQVRPSLVRKFIRYRQEQGMSAPTISRDLKALRSPINWAVTEHLLSAAPKIPDVKGKAKRRELEYSPEQIAAILDRAAATPERAHILLYMMIFLSTNGRSEAILDLVAETQIRKGLIFFNAPGREQTRKFRSIVPIAPTLAPWFEGVTGKVIRYRALTSEATRAAGGPDYFEKPVADLGKSFAACVIEAGILRPDLELCRQAVDAEGMPIMLPPRRKLGETEMRPKMVAVGTPNTLRHSIHTYLAARGVPKAQIDTAAGHATDAGTGDRYNHLRPAYLTDFIEGVESFWAEVGAFTTAHLRYQRDTKMAISNPFGKKFSPPKFTKSAQVIDKHGEVDGALEGIRTPDPCLRRAVLYPAELRVRTHVRPSSPISGPPVPS